MHTLQQAYQLLQYLFQLHRMQAQAPYIPKANTQPENEEGHTSHDCYFQRDLQFDFWYLTY